jgi:hypothetical protein
MAASKSTSDELKYKNFPEIIKQLQIIKDLENEIAQEQQKKKTASKEEKKQIDNIIVAKKKAFSEERRTLGFLKNEKNKLLELDKQTLDFSKSFARYSKEVKDNLTGTSAGARAYSSLNVEIIKEKIRQKDLTGEELEASVERVAKLTEISDATKEQAEAAAKAKGEAIFQNKFALKRKELEEDRLHYTEEQYKAALDNLHIEESLYHKEERLTELKEAQKELYEEAPESLKSAIDFTKKLGKAMLNGPAMAILLVGAALLAGLESFKELDKAAEDYRKTSGMTVKQTEHLAHQAHEIEVAYRGAGVELKHIFDVSNDLANVFGDMTHFSTATYAALGGIQARTGATSETAAKVQGIFEQVAGVSSDTAASLQMQIASLAQQGKVSPKEVLEDIAENAEATSTFFKGDVTALKNQVIQAHQLGTTLTKVAATAEKLLDFETGIEDELLAATFVGGQFNLSTARGLAYAGKTVEAQEEILNQLNQGIGFKNQDIFAQKALAKAAGMSIEDINKQLTMKEKLAHLSGEDKKNAEEAVKAGLDLTNVNDEQLKQKTDEFIAGQKITGQLTDMENTFKGIVATVGGALTPLFSVLAKVLEVVMKPISYAASLINEMLSNMYILVPLVALLAIHFRTAAMNALKGAAGSIVSAIGSIYTSLAKIPFGLGFIGAGAIVAAMISQVSRAKSVGDIKSPADGKTQVSTKEGGLFTLSPNDDLVAAPGAASKLDEAAKLGKTATQPFGGGGAFAGAAINILVNEMKQMRKDMASKSTDVYMDGSKVTANVASNVNKSTRNNFTLGQG